MENNIFEAADKEKELAAQLETEKMLAELERLKAEEQRARDKEMARRQVEWEQNQRNLAEGSKTAGAVLGGGAIGALIGALLGWIVGCGIECASCVANFGRSHTDASSATWIVALICGGLGALIGFAVRKG